MPKLLFKRMKASGRFAKPSEKAGGGVGEEAKPAGISVMDYDSMDLRERQIQSVEETFPFRDTSTVTWINVEGLSVQTIQAINAHYSIHPLVCEHIVHTGQRPKIEDYDDYLFFVLKMISFNEEVDSIDAEQVSLVLGKNYVISFQEGKEGDVFDPVRQRIRESKGRMRQLGADHLAYALVDAIVDHYFVVLEKIGARIDGLESEIVREVKPDMPQQIYKLKSEMIFLKKQIWPLRELVNTLNRTESALITKGTQIYLRDVYDHTIQVNDTIDSFREALAGLHDIHLSGISNRMNEIMKILTIFSTIFIPLTFLAGVYGMNFEHMPELKWRYGYFIVLFIMAVIALGMIVFVKKRRWF